MPQILHRPADLRALRLQAGPDPRRLRRGRRPRRRLRRPGRHDRDPRRLRLADDPGRRADVRPQERPPAPAARLPVRPVAARPATRFVDECDAAGWYGEETLDVEAVHAMAPAGATSCTSGRSSCQDADLNAAMNTVVDNQLAQVITNSYGNAGEPASTGRRRGGATRRSCRPPPRASACCSPPATTATRSPTPARGRSTTRRPTPG